MTVEIIPCKSTEQLIKNEIGVTNKTNGELSPFKIVKPQPVSPLSFNRQKKYSRKSTLNPSISPATRNRLCDQPSTTPVRVSQYLVDVDYIKAKAEEKINNYQSPDKLMP